MVLATVDGLHLKSRGEGLPHNLEPGARDPCDCISSEDSFAKPSRRHCLEQCLNQFFPRFATYLRICQHLRRCLNIPTHSLPSVSPITTATTPTTSHASRRQYYSLALHFTACHSLSLLRLSSLLCLPLRNCSRPRRPLAFTFPLIQKPRKQVVFG